MANGVLPPNGHRWYSWITNVWAVIPAALGTITALLGMAGRRQEQQRSPHQDDQEALSRLEERVDRRFDLLERTILSDREENERRHSEILRQLERIRQPGTAS